MLLRHESQEVRRDKGSVNGWSSNRLEPLPRFEFSSEAAARLTHQLFRFPAKFHAPVVRELIERFSEPGQHLVDPFCGSGTLLVEAALAGRDATGYDVDPLAVLVANAKSQPVDVDAFRAAGEAITRRLDGLVRSSDECARRDRPSRDLTNAEYEAEVKGLTRPAIPKLDHWFRRYVVVDLARLRDAIGDLEVEPPVRRLLMVVFASMIRAASNADPVPVSGLERTRHFRERDEAGRIVDVGLLFKRKLARAEKDVAAFLSERSSSTTRALEADATDELPGTPEAGFDVAITSPPYHGAVDYYRRHQLEMFWLSLTESQTDRLSLLDRYLGRPHVPQRHEFVRDSDLSAWPAVAECEAGIRAEAPRRADEFRHYCVGMGRALRQLSRTLRPSASAVLVVGRSRWNGADLDTSRLLAELGAPHFQLNDELWYPVKNRHMSYGRKNGANIDREFVLVFERKATSIEEEDSL